MAGTRSGLALSLAVAASAFAADPPALPPLFENTDTLRVQIEGPISTLLRERSDTDYYEGKFRYADEDGVEREFELKFRARGNFRRQRENCRFPPVRLNFKRKALADSELEGQNALKLVTHCRPKSHIYERLVLKEYLAYKIFEQHTDFSFRTRLMKISWIDTDDNNKVDEKYGFVIEHKNGLAARLGAEVAEVESTSYDQLDHRQASIASIFQYLIGNTDYSMIKGPPDDSCCHNSILLTKDGETHIPIPYDFDFSGIVDAPYASPNPRFSISEVTTRLYRGNCRLSDEAEDSIALFLEKQPAVMQLIEDQEGLSRSTRGSVRAFVRKFYRDISNPRHVQRTFVKECS